MRLRMRVLVWLTVVLLALAGAAVAFGAPIPDPHETALSFDVCPEGCPFSPATITNAFRAADAAGNNVRAAMVNIAPGLYDYDASWGSFTGNVTIRGSGRGVTVLRETVHAVGILQQAGGELRIEDLTLAINQDTGAFSCTGGNGQLTVLRRVECINTINVTAGITWAGTAAGARLELEDVYIRHVGGGVLVTSAVDSTYIFRGVRTQRDPVADTATLNTVDRGIDFNPGSGVHTVVASGLFVQGGRPALGDVLSGSAGISMRGAGTTDATVHGAVIRIDENGTSAAGTVYGIHQDSSSAASILTCYDCDVTVDRSSTGQVVAAGADGTAASRLSLYGGRYRASGAEADPNEIERASSSTLDVHLVNLSDTPNDISFLGQGALDVGVDVHNQDTRFYRVGYGQGAACATGSFTLSAGWGATAAVTLLEGNNHDQVCSMRVTANGAGLAANPTITYTLPAGAPPGSVHALVVRAAVSAAADEAAATTWTTTGTTIVATWRGTPTAARTYDFTFLALYQ